MHERRGRRNVALRGSLTGAYLPRRGGRARDRAEALQVVPAAGGARRPRLGACQGDRDECRPGVAPRDCQIDDHGEVRGMDGTPRSGGPRSGTSTGAEALLGKLAASYVARAANRVHTAITGTESMLTGDDSPMNGVIAEILISTPAISIGRRHR